MITTTYSLLKEKTRYLQAFFANPRAFGSIAPSSSALCRTMSEAVDWQQTQRIAELGAGDGVLTRHLLHSMRADATLAAYEINPQLAHKLNAFNDLRLTVHTDSAETLGTGYDAIFSGLPLLSLPQALRERDFDANQPGADFRWRVCAISIYTAVGATVITALLLDAHARDAQPATGICLSVPGCRTSLKTDSNKLLQFNIKCRRAETHQHPI